MAHNRGQQRSPVGDPKEVLMFRRIARVALPLVVLAAIAAVTVGTEAACCLPQLYMGGIPLPAICF
jgi:hypothetical protein